MSFRVQVVSDTVTAKLLAARADIQKAIGEAFEQAGNDMEAHSREIVPVRTGHLQSSIYHHVDDLRLELGASASYALYVECGTRRMAAEAFIRPSAEEGQANLLSLVRDGILWAFQ